MNRRTFIGMAGVIGAAGAARIDAGPAETVAPPHQRLFQLGMVTYNLGRAWSLDDLIRNCEETGFRGVELRTTHRHGVEPDISDQERSAVRRRFEQTSVKLVCLGTACEFHSPDRDEVRRNIERSRRFLELAADVGATGIKVRPNGIPEEVPEETTLKQIGSALAEVGEIASRHKVEVWLEVHGRRSSHPPLIRKMLDYCGHPMVGITWNSNQTDLEDGRLQPYFELLQSDIRNVHINQLTSGYPYRELFTRLRRIGYAGFTLAEIQEVEGEPTRFMRYYKELWHELSKAPEC